MKFSITDILSWIINGNNNVSGLEKELCRPIIVAYWAASLYFLSFIKDWKNRLVQFVLILLVAFRFFFTQDPWYFSENVWKSLPGHFRRFSHILRIFPLFADAYVISFTHSEKIQFLLWKYWFFLMMRR